MAAHVADLVGEHTGELVVVVHPREQPREHEHVAPGNGEGVQRRMLHHEEAVVEALRAEDADQLLANPLDVRGDRGILDDGQLAAGREQEAPAELTLVEGSRRGGQRDHGREPQPERPCHEATLHAWPRLRAATSFAKYVMMMSAPARLIATRLSSTTRASSSQPRAAAAFTMAYSPLTW